jgi:hypothetical protein
MLNQGCARRFAGECLIMSRFLKLNESHLEELGFRMGDSVILMEWINKMNTDCAQLQPSSSLGHLLFKLMKSVTKCRPQHKM